MEQTKKSEKTPVRDRWLVKMFSPPSIGKIGHAVDANFCNQQANVYGPPIKSQLRQPTRFTNGVQNPTAIA